MLLKVLASCQNYFGPLQSEPKTGGPGLPGGRPLIRLCTCISFISNLQKQRQNPPSITKKCSTLMQFLRKSQQKILPDYCPRWMNLTEKTDWSAGLQSVVVNSRSSVTGCPPSLPDQADICKKEKGTIKTRAIKDLSLLRYSVLIMDHYPQTS